MEFNTAEILRQLKADGGSSQKVKKKGPRNDKLRIAQLYGSGVGNIKNIQGRLKPIMKGDDSDYQTRKSNDHIDYSALVEEKLLNSPLWHKHGVIRLEQLWSGSRMSITDLIKQFHQHYDVALSRNEAAGLVKQWQLLVTEKKRTNINFNNLLTRLCALHESMRKKSYGSRKEEEEQLKKRKEDRIVRPNVPGEAHHDSDETRRRAGLIQLQRCLYKLNVCVPQLYMLEPQHFLTMVNKEVHGALSVGLLRDFCRFNLKIEVSAEEAAALLAVLDYGQAGKIPLSTWLYELKKLGLGMSGLLDPIVLDFDAEEEAGAAEGPLHDTRAHKLLQQQAAPVMRTNQSHGGGQGHAKEVHQGMEEGEEEGDEDWDARMARAAESMGYREDPHRPTNTQARTTIPLPAQLVQVRIKEALPSEAKLSNILSPIVDRRQGRRGAKVILGSPAAVSHRVQFSSPDSNASGSGDADGSFLGVGELEQLSVISSKILETSKQKKSKYNFHSSGISIPRMDPTEAERVLSKKQQHSPDFVRQRSQVIRVSPSTGKAKLV